MERIRYQEVPAELFKQLFATETLLNQGPLEVSLLEMIRLRVAQLNACAYCVDMHFKEWQALESSELRLHSLCIWQTTPYFTDKERVVLELTELLSQQQDSEIEDLLFEQLLHHFSKAEICYLTLAINQINTWTGLMKCFQFTPGRYKVTPKE